MKKVRNTKIKRRTLESWFIHARGFINSAQYLEDTRIMVGLGGSSGLSAWFLLHLAVESYLKAVIINFTNELPKIHDLVLLVDSAKRVNKKVCIELEKKIEGRKVEEWIRYINHFRYPDGGLRYINTRSSIFVAPVGVTHYFDSLISVIDKECDHAKDITEIVNTEKSF